MHIRQYRISSGGKKPTQASTSGNSKPSSKTSISTGLGSKIDDLNADLFLQLESVQTKERLGELGEEFGLGKPLNKYERLAAIGKNHVMSNASQDYEEKKMMYENERKKEKKAKKKKKVTKDLGPNDPLFFVTGAGVEQAEEDSYSEDEGHREEFRDKVNALPELDDEMNEIFESVMKEIKEECFKMRSVDRPNFRERPMTLQRSEGC